MKSQRRREEGFFKGRDKCGLEDNCPSKWYKYGENGMLVCENGHEQGVVQSQTADDDWTARQSQGKTVKISGDRSTKKSTRIVTGIAGLNLYLSCYQIILRHQCKALIQSKGFPPELEPIVKDLWCLRLPRIHDKVGLRIRLNAGEQEDDADFGERMFSSQTESSGGDTDAERLPVNERRRELPSLTDSLALCYIGLMVLRSPISAGELHRLAIREEIPFIRPLRLIPAEIRRNLATRWINLLETHHALQPDHLNESIRRLLYQYQRHFGLSLPSLNFQPLLFWYIHELALPLQLYTIVKKLSHILSLDFSFPTRKPKKGRHPPLPELTLVALLVVAVKLYHPFGTSRKYARSVTDPAYLVLDWNTWSASLKQENKLLRGAKPFMPGEQMYAVEDDVLDFSDEQMDAYMDWFSSTWTEPPREENSKTDIPEEILGMFPTYRTKHDEQRPTAAPSTGSENPHSIHKERLSKVVRSIKPREIISNERAESFDASVDRVGMNYRIYTEAGELSGYAKEFHEVLAEKAAISVSKLLSAVRTAELNLLTWKRTKTTKADGKQTK